MSDSGGVNVLIARNKNYLLGSAIAYNKDCVKLAGLGKFLDEVDGYGMPRPKGYRKWFEKSVRPMAGFYVTSAQDTRCAELFDKGPAFRPGIISANEG